MTVYCQHCCISVTDRCFADIGTIGPVEETKVPVANSFQGKILDSVVSCILYCAPFRSRHQLSRDLK